jgi:hypothetical protein
MISGHLKAQHLNKMTVDVDYDAKVFTIKQEIIYHNQSKDTLHDFVLNDWNNAYSDKTTPLGKRFSDEFKRGFHMARDKDRGYTKIYSITDPNNRKLVWTHPKKHPDIVDVQIQNAIYPNQKFSIFITYEVKIPDSRFTGTGYSDNGNFNLKDWFLTPARIKNNTFVEYSNENLEDIANALCDYEITLRLAKSISMTTDLDEVSRTTVQDSNEYKLSGKSRLNFMMAFEPKNSFNEYNNGIVNVNSNLSNNGVTEIQKAYLTDQIVNFTADKLGAYPYKKIMITQADYNRNPVYGLNQLPSFLRPFPDAFIYEIRFLKTYLNTYLKNTLKLDPRKDSWIYNAIQVDLMSKYVDQYHSDKKMMGLLSNIGLFKGHHLFRLNFNDQYTYFSLIMARKNLDQPIGDPKNTFIKFNEQIAGKAKAGLSLKYLDAYLGKDIVPNSVNEFYKMNLSENQTDRTDFENIIKSKTPENLDWFFDTVVNTRALIDYRLGSVKREKDSLKITVKNVTGTNVPISIYGLKKDQVVFKEWLTNIKTDTVFTVARGDADRLALNYNNEVPEYNSRNNWKSLKGFFSSSRPVKFTFFQDIEDPHHAQIFYVPTFAFNVYDGFSPGLRLHNKSILEKPFIFDISPTYSIKTGELIGSFSLLYNHYIREGELFNVRYNLNASTYHYAPDASYRKFTPSVQFRLRETDFRENKKQFILLRQVTVNREQSAFVDTDEQNENYSVFNARYSKFESEITRHYNFYTDVQISGSFGKLSGEVQYRRLFNNNRQINLRFFAGMFMYRSTNSEFFSFGLDRPTDYLFDYNYYGRSETEGFFSQQFIMAEGGFKSQFDTRFANQWMTTANGSFNIWNWIEIYGDAGMFKNKYNSTEFVYDSGIRLNFVPDYFEVYFPLYSSNGFEPSLNNYNEKIRFVITISPGALIGLFTRKWL